MTTTFSAPGKIYISGEHAVLYGELAIACAIDLRAYVTVRKSDITSISANMTTSNIKTELNLKDFPYLSAAIETTGVKNISIDIKSDIPIGSGLGSSAAVTVATLAAINKEFLLGYDNQNIARIGYEIEKNVQGSASPTDTTVSTFGGLFEMPTRRRLTIPDCYIVVGNTNRSKNTSKVISKVKIFKEEYPDVIDPIIKTIGLISKKEALILIQKDYVSLGKLMDVNHSLLDALGVCTAELSTLVHASRRAGAFGAKLTGAGGGGCMIAITDSPNNIAKAIKEAGGSAIITKPTTEGLIHEWRKI